MSEVIFLCPKCDHQSPTVQGLRSHLKKTHGLSVEDVPRDQIQ